MPVGAQRKSAHPHHGADAEFHDPFTFGALAGMEEAIILLMF